MKIFKVISGLKINMAKSCMASINEEDRRLGELASMMGCKVGSWPFTYLGLPLGGRSKSISFWDLVVE